MKNFFKQFLKFKEDVKNLKKTFYSKKVTKTLKIKTIIHLKKTQDFILIIDKDKLNSSTKSIVY